MSDFEIRLCSMHGCDKPVRTVGWCNMHYLRWWKTGDPLRGRKPEAERVWEKIDTSLGDEGCWPWMATTDRSGYGQTHVGGRGGRNIGAHRWVDSNAVGPIPDGHHVLHKCDNPPCCNPAHLFTGTDADNVLDMDVKGRRRTRVTAEHVRQIRARYAGGGVPQHRLAAEFGIGQAQVSKIVRGESWAHLSRETA